RIFVRDLTPETHGNAIGIGLADITTSRLVRAMDRRVTSLNALTAMTPQCAKIPICFDTDKEAVETALGSLAISDTRQARVVRIRDTLSLENMEISEALEPDMKTVVHLTATGPLQQMSFTPEENFESLRC